MLYLCGHYSNTPSYHPTILLGHLLLGETFKALFMVHSFINVIIFLFFSPCYLQFLCLLNMKHTKICSSWDLWETGKCFTHAFKDTWWQRLWLRQKKPHPSWCSLSCSQKTHTFLDLSDCHNLLWNSLLLSLSGLKKWRYDFLTRREYE